MIGLKILSILIFISEHTYGFLSSQPRLGRTVHLGDLYNAKNDRVMAGLSLWDTEIIDEHKKTQESPNTKIDALVEKDFEDRANVFNLNARVQMSFLAGLIEVGGSAKFLRDEKNTNNKVRVVGYVTNVNRTESLSVGKMISSVQYGQFCTAIPDVTHVVSSVTYGLKAIFSFEKEETNKAKQQKID